MINRDLQRLEDAGTPIRVGLVGAGYIGVPAAVQLIRHVPGIRVAAIASHQLADAGRAYQLTGQKKLLVAETASQVNRGVHQGQPVIARDGLLLAQSDEIDVILDLTANIEGGRCIGDKWDNEWQACHRLQCRIICYGGAHPEA